MDARKARHAGGDRRRCAAGTFASDYDTTLSVYTGRPGSLTQIACNDDSGDLQSRVRFSTVAGTTYFVMAGSSDATPGGMLQLTMEELPPASWASRWPAPRRSTETAWPGSPAR